MSECTLRPELGIAPTPSRRIDAFDDQRQPHQGSYGKDNHPSVTKFQQRRTRRSTAFEYQRIFTPFQKRMRGNPAKIFPSEKTGICRRTSDNDSSLNRRDRRKNRFCQPLSLLTAICQTIRPSSGTLPELLSRPENMIYQRSRSHALSSAVDFSVSRTQATSSRSRSLWIILPGIESG